MLIFYLRVIYSHRIGTEMDRVKFCWLGDGWEEWCWWAKVSKSYCECGLSIGQGLSRQPPRWGERGSCGFVKSKSNQIKSNRGKKRCLMICKLQRGSDCLHPQLWPRPPPVFSIQLCCSPYQNSLILNNNNSSIFFVIIIFYGNT